VYCSEVLEHLADPRAALAEIERIVATHGVAVVSVPNERLINTLKAVVRRAGLSRAVLRTGPNDYAMPERMDDEWHLHTFDLKSLLSAIPRGLRVARVEAIPFRWLPLRYVARCEPADPPVAGRPRRRSWLAGLYGRWAGSDLRAVKRRIQEWLRVTPCGRILDAGCGAGELASLAPADYLGLDTDAAAVARARRRYRRDARKRFLVADAAVAHLPVDFFDVGLVRGTAEPGGARLAAIARATRGPIVLVQPAGTSVESLRASLAHAGLGVDRDEATREHHILLCRRRNR
jgi:SAM-dependent methyltransferase